MQRVLSTSDFAAAIGLSESSVRRLADRGQLEFHRTKGGHRRIPISEAVRYVRETGARVLRPELLGLVDSVSQRPGSGADEPLLNALYDGHAKGVISVLQSMYASGESIADICDGPIRHAMAVIGDRWPNDKRSIFIEHRATLLCVRALCQIRLSIPDPDEHAPTALGGAPTDDPFLLPSLMVSLVLHDCGYDETNLGPNTPLDVLTDAVEDEQPNLVWLALSTPVRSRTHELEIRRLVESMDRYGGQMVIGGKGAETFNHPAVTNCGSMSELSDLATALAQQDNKPGPNLERPGPNLEGLNPADRDG